MPRPAARPSDDHVPEDPASGPVKSFERVLRTRSGKMVSHVVTESLQQLRRVSHRREEVYNVTLAELLTGRGAANSEAERSHSHEVPDVTFEWFGLVAVLEAKYDQPGAAVALGTQLGERLAAGFGTLGVALLYPPDLKFASGDVAVALEPAEMRVQLSAVGRPPGKWHDVNGIEGLVAVLDQARAELIDDDALRQSVEMLSASVDVLARALASQPGHADDLVAVVTATTGEMSTDATPQQKETADRVAALAVITAAMLQMILSDRDKAVPPLIVTSPEKQRKALLVGWRKVLDHDYRAVFEIAEGVLRAMGDSDSRLGAALVWVLERAEKIVTRGVFGRHDLVGRVYHSLLTSQKYLATYYTSVPAATMLAALAAAPDLWPDVDWSAEPDEFAFTFADPACGTGTLLAATLGTIRRHYATARRRSSRPVDAQELGRRLIEDNSYGFDILAYAVQVCAATMLLSSPGTIVSGSHLYQLPFGGKNGDLGSLDLLRGSAQGSLFGTWGERITVNSAAPTPGADRRLETVAVPEVDLVIMNPPFTRTQGGSRLLGSLNAEEWPKARENLDGLAKRQDVEGRVVAGLGSLFVPLADRMVREGGRVALVLPKTMLTGLQWDRTRHLLSAGYHVETVICSHEADHWNFSDSTQLAEVLLVCRKLRSGEDRTGHRTLWVQLSHNPRNPIDALGITTALLRIGDPGSHGAAIRLGSGLFAEFGQAFSRPSPSTAEPWHHGVFFSGELDLAATSMVKLLPVPLPRIRRPMTLPLMPLSQLATIGPDRARLHDGFQRTAAPTSYPVLWGHDSEATLGMTERANEWLTPSARRHPEHARQYSAELWRGAGPLMIAERMWLTTYRACALLLDQPALSNVMWPVRLREESEGAYRILTLWLNSTLGLVAWMGLSEETRGPWLSMKKNKLQDLPVIEPWALPESARRRLLDCWDELVSEPLMPVAKAAYDDVRARIDGALASALGIPADGFQALRILFAAEPRVRSVEPAARHREAPEAELLSLFG